MRMKEAAWQASANKCKTSEADYRNSGDIYLIPTSNMLTDKPQMFKVIF